MKDRERSASNELHEAQCGARAGLRHMELHVRTQKENVTRLSTLSVDKLCLPALEQGGGDAA